MPAEPWWVRLYDGTAFQTRSFALAADKLLIEDPTFGRFQLALSDVVEIVRQQSQR